MTDVCIGLGSNVGDKAGNLREALRLLTCSRAAEITLRAVSSLYRTAPVGYLDQDWFLNAAAHAGTQLNPRELLNRLLAIESELGRVRTVPNGPRTIDLDILFWGDLVVNEDDLVIPHPRLHERLFVLEPLAEIAPDLRHPLLGVTVGECRAALAARADSETGVVRVEGPSWIQPPAR